jgi:HEAT repeat protein
MKTSPDGDTPSAANGPLGRVIANLAGDKQLRHTELIELSNITRADLATFRQVWTTIPFARRRDIVTRLVEMAEDNAELTFNHIFRVLLRDGDSEVRETAIESLWEDDSTSLITIFIKMMAQDASEDVQAAAAAALGKFALFAECGKLRDVYSENISQALLTVVNNKAKPIEVRRRALESVSAFSLPAVTEAIKTAYVSGNHEYKMSALFAMGRHSDRAVLPILTAELSSNDAETRYEAVSALGEMGEERAVSHLIELLDDKDSDVQTAVIRSLGEIGGLQAKKVLEKCLTSPNEAIAEIAADALEELHAGETPLDFRF